MRHCIEQSNGLVPSLLCPSWVDCIIATRGYDFRKGQDCIIATCGCDFRKGQVTSNHRSRRRPWPRTRKANNRLRRECLDHMVIFGETHLRRILSAYAVYYNQSRTHLALNKDCPLERTIQRFGSVVAIPVLAGLHHQYARM